MNWAFCYSPCPGRVRNRSTTAVPGGWFRCSTAPDQRQLPVLPGSASQLRKRRRKIIAGTAIGPRRGFPETASSRTSENNRQLSGIIGLTCGYVLPTARIPDVTSKPPETNGIIAQRRDTARARQGQTLSPKLLGYSPGAEVRPTADGSQRGTAARPAFAASRHPTANPTQRARGKRNPEGSSFRAQRSNRCMEGPRRGRTRCHAELGKN